MSSGAVNSILQVYLLVDILQASQKQLYYARLAIVSLDARPLAQEELREELREDV